jgi:hypothetical protein
MLQIRDIYKKGNAVEPIAKQKLNVDETWNKLHRMGLIVDDKDHLANYDGIKDAWKDEPCYVIGTSRGIEGIDLDLLEGKHTIGINHLIDYWDKMEWFLFIDKRFLDVTSYDLKKFKGRIFASNKTGYFDKGATVFQLNNSSVSRSIEQGLYRGSLSGICALNLAVISGANPIYMLGLDSGGVKDKSKGTHFIKNYPGEKIDERSHTTKYRQLNSWMRAFNPYRDRIINVDPKGEIPHFKKISFGSIPGIKDRKNFKLKRVCHVQTLEMENMGEITRSIYENAIGKHMYCKLEDLQPPDADIYILHCFSKRNNEFANWQKPKGAKVISIVHSDKNCYPAACSDKVVFLTKAHSDKYKLPEIKKDVISGGINTAFYNIENKKYDKIVIGRICRSVPEKFHKEYFKVCEMMIKKYNAEVLIITKDSKDFPKIDGIRYESVDINDREKKKKLLSEITIGFWANGDFVDVFPIELLEMHSMSIPVASCMENQPSSHEAFEGWNTFEETIQYLELLCQSESMRIEAGKKARSIALQYDQRKMIVKYNKLLEDL